MSNIRLIPRLDVKGANLIKGIHLEGLRVIGNPNEFARKYYEDGADEIIYMDVVASLYGRNNMLEIVKQTTQNIFIPITVGGGIRTIDDVKTILRAGADKVAVNTAAIKNPNIIKDISQRCGSQCMVLSIEAKKIEKNKWEAYIDNGRESTGIDVLEWAIRGVHLGAGEILLTSVDKEGTRKGFDVDLIYAVSNSVNVPVIASGGMGNIDHMIEVINKGRADAIAIADILHYNRKNLNEIRKKGLEAGLTLRQI